MKKPVYFFSVTGLVGFLSLFFYFNTSEKSEELVFLENVMIREGGLYVLMGSKPMVSFDVRSGIPETAEEYQKHLEYAKIKYPEDRIETFEEYKISNRLDKHIQYSELWEDWETKMKNYVGPHFQFVTRRYPFGENLSERRNLEGLFINNCSLLYVLTVHYSEFEKVFGAPFEPKKVLEEISDLNSIFWERAFRNQYTQGLLFGYGSRNSFNFSWQIENNFPFAIRFFQDISLLIKTKFDKKKVNVSDLLLPPISLYFLGDPVLESYKLQRKEILKEFKGKDFESTVKRWLGSGMTAPQ